MIPSPSQSFVRCPNFPPRSFSTRSPSSPLTTRAPSTLSSPAASSLAPPAGSPTANQFGRLTSRAGRRPRRTRLPPELSEQLRTTPGVRSSTFKSSSTFGSSSLPQRTGFRSSRKRQLSRSMSTIAWGSWRWANKGGTGARIGLDYATGLVRFSRSFCARRRFELGSELRMESSGRIRTCCWRRWRRSL